MPWQDDPVIAPAAGSWMDDPIISAPGAQTSRPSDPSLYSKTDAFKNALLNYGQEAVRQVGRTGQMLSFGAGRYFDPEGVLADRSPTERVVSRVGETAAGAGLGIGAGVQLAKSGSQLLSGIGRSLATQPAAQAAGTVTGPVAEEVAREYGAGPTGQLVAGLAGSVAPSIGAAGGAELVRRAARGGEAGRVQMAGTLRDFAAAGDTPSVGQATQRRAMQASEGYLARSPGGAGRMAGKAKQQAVKISGRLDDLAETLAQKSSAEQTGRAVSKGVSGPGGFVEQFKATQVELYDKLDKFIPQTTRVDVSRTQSALKELNQSIEGAENVSKFFQNAKIKGIESALTKDIEVRPEMDDAAADLLDAIRKVDPAKAESWAAEIFRDGKLPYEAVKKLRTFVGNELSDWGIASDVPRSKWKALYAALSDDLGSAASGAGPQAREAWLRANRYTSAGMDRIDLLQSVVDKNGGPEAIYRAVTVGTKDGATTLRAVMQSLPETAQKQLAATMVRRLGMAPAGVQNEAGDVFSTEVFLSNWNRLSPEAKRVVFDRFGQRFSVAMDKVAKVAANLRGGSQVFRNPSGTAQALTQGTTAGAAAMALLTGHVAYATSIGGYVAANNMAARLMTNPRFVNWLALATDAPISAIPSLAANLAQAGRKNEDEDLQAFALELAFKDAKKPRDYQP